MKVLTVRLDDDLHARAVKAAEQDARSLNGELNWLIKTALDARTPQAQHGSDEKKSAEVKAHGRSHNREPGIRCWCHKVHEPSRTVVGYSKKKQLGDER